MIGQKIIDSAGKNYTIKNEIGRGGFGIVYLAQDSESRDYAVKMMGPVDKSDILESFKREISAASVVTHDNLLHFIEQGEHEYNGAKYFFAINEYCPDGNYKKVLAERGFSLKLILSEFQQILMGLEALHQHVIHRDIKPENIFVVKGKLKVGDLGLSKSIDEVTKTLTFKGSGTPMYMAPEIWERGRIIPASDLYAIGVMLFEATTGQFLFESDELIDLRDMHLYNPAPRVKSINKDIPDYIDGVIKKLLEKDSVNRYQSAQEVIDVIKSVPSTKASESVSILRSRIRQSHDSMESHRLEEERKAKEEQQIQKKISYMEQQLISKFDDAIQEINKELQETKITINSQSNRAYYYFGNRTLQISFFGRNALYNNDLSSGLHKELEKRYVIHAGSIYIEENGDNREGWNVVLIQSPGESYGKWLLIESGLSVLSGRALKYSPAATDARLLSENLAYHWTPATHIWKLKDKAFEESDVESILDKFIPKM